LKRPGRAAILVLTVVLAACASPSTGSTMSNRTPGSPKAPPPTLAQAIRAATHLGPAGPGTRVELDFGLKTRQPARLSALIASGRTVSPAEYTSQFGPDPALVAQALDFLRGSGLTATWISGSTLIQASGPAPVVDALLGVVIQSYRQPDGFIFYATTDTPILAPRLQVVAESVAGLDSYRRVQGAAVPPGGLTPTDILLFYNLKPLRARGLDGTGETILFPEIETIPRVNIDDLNQFATKFGLPAFDNVLTIKHDPSWGTPEKPIGEAVLDLEIAHEIAPNAKLVVYQAGPQAVFVDRAFDQMVTDHLGSIISESLGVCELDTVASLRAQYSTTADRSVALGMSHYAATGDNGAYSCGEDQQPAALFPSTLPTVTAVGGTTVFESVDGAYYKESAWGSPIDQAGTGGGASAFYPLPSWQKGVQDANGHGFRQVPDIAGDADPITGFAFLMNGRLSQAGGTSASTPLWAATTALINQDLVAKRLREAGFANPALYWMGANQSNFSSPPFHDVTFGNNLAYSAGPGWDFATGWGSMDGVALDTAWITYIKSGGA
jgi:subtilase family serine protease